MFSYDTLKTLLFRKYDATLVATDTSMGNAFENKFYNVDMKPPDPGVDMKPENRFRILILQTQIYRSTRPN